MVIFDTVTCDYPLPDPRHQHLEFQTKDLEKVLGHYTITRDGRLIRHAQPSPFAPAPVSDVEWPIHGDHQDLRTRPRLGPRAHRVRRPVHVRARRLDPASAAGR